MILGVLLALLGCTRAEPIPEDFGPRAAWVATRVHEALEQCEREVVAPLRQQDPRQPTMTSDQVREGCGAIGNLDATHRETLVGRDRGVDQLFAGTVRVAEDVRILVMELEREPRDPHTTKGGVDHLVGSVPAILPIAARLQTGSPTPWSLEVGDAKGPDRRRKAAAILERLQRDLDPLAGSFEGLAWLNRSAAIYVRHAMLSHSGRAARARLAESLAELRAIGIDPDPCDDAARAYLDQYDAALQATQGPPRPEAAWDADRDAVHGAHDTWLACLQTLRGRILEPSEEP